MSSVIAGNGCPFRAQVLCTGVRTRVKHLVGRAGLTRNSFLNGLLAFDLGKFTDLVPRPNQNYVAADLAGQGQAV